MPISGPASYVSTTEAFLTHWLACDTALGVGHEISVTGGVVRAGLQTLLNALVAKRIELQADLIDEEIARSDVELRKQALLLRANQFNDRIRGAFAGTKWERVLKPVPAFNDAQSKFTDPLGAMARLWRRINADPATPAAVTLQGGYAEAQLVADIAALKAAFTTWTAAGVDAKISLEDRNDLQDAIHPILKDYRSAMPTYFVAGHALTDSLPALTPAPGSTPDAPRATFTYLPATNQVKIEWGVPTSSNIVQVEVRYCAGLHYDTDVESVIGNIAPDAPRQFITDTGLGSPGNVAGFKVYFITDTLNEKGSNTLIVTRPAAPPAP